MKIPERMRFLRIRRFLEGKEGFPDVVTNYLLPHERTVVAVHRHPGVFVTHINLALSCCAVAVLLNAMGSWALVLAAAWGAFFVLFLWLSIRVMVWAEEYFVATEYRLIFITGLIKRKATTVPLREIGDLSMRRSTMGMIVGYGEFIAKPARPGYKIPNMNYMPYPDQLLSELQNVLEPQLADDDPDDKGISIG